MEYGNSQWRVIGAECRPGPMTMALEEVAAETVAAGGPATVRVYGWPDVLSLGFAQDPESVDWAFCEREGIGVTRRPTGGGAIYHDAVGDISYGIVVSAADVPGDLLTCYHELCEPVLESFDRLGVEAAFTERARDAAYRPACYLRETNPAHDVVGPDGRKISGNAQYRQQDVVIQHGSLSYSLRPRRHCGCFAGDPSPETFAERVGAIDEYADVDRERAVRTLRETLASWVDAEAGEWSDAELARAVELAETKYGADEWVRRDP